MIWHRMENTRTPPRSMSIRRWVLFVSLQAVLNSKQNTNVFRSAIRAVIVELLLHHDHLRFSCRCQLAIILDMAIRLQMGYCNAIENDFWINSSTQMKVTEVFFRISSLLFHQLSALFISNNNCVPFQCWSSIWDTWIHCKLLIERQR